MGRGDDEDDDIDQEDMEQVLFQGPMFGRETNLKQNPRLVKAALVPVKKMISDGLSRRAHSILLEPSQGRVTIRFVVDGIPYPAGAIPGQRGMAMIQMIKVLAGLNSQERNEPQSGGINAEFEEVRYELLTDTVLLKPGVERLKIRVENPKITYLKPADVGNGSGPVGSSCGDSRKTARGSSCLRTARKRCYLAFHLCDTQCRPLFVFGPQHG